MRAFSTEFSAHIARETTTLCWVWKLIRKDGTVLGFTDHDLDLEIGSVIYQAASGLSPSGIDSRIGFALDNGSVQGLLSSEVIKDIDIRAGKYDSARIEISRVNWDNSTQIALIWSGKLGDIKSISGQFEAELIGHAAVLERSTGRVFARGCDASFGDERCGLNVGDFPPNTGCPHSYTACQSQFNNIVNFRGFPYMIGEDAAYAAPRDGDFKDGSSRY